MKVHQDPPPLSRRDFQAQTLEVLDFDRAYHGLTLNVARDFLAELALLLAIAHPFCILRCAKLLRGQPFHIMRRHRKFWLNVGLSDSAPLILRSHPRS